MKTQVCIVGAGPAGLLLGHFLRTEGIECVVLERRTPDYVLGRIRAGVLERITVSLMERLGLDERLKAEGLPHDGFNLADGERLIRIDIADLTGKHVVVYGQTELTRDLMDAREERGLEVIYEAADVALHDIESDAPFVTFTKDGAERRVDCRIIAGCDGFHGPSRRSIPAGVGTTYEREYAFGWLGGRYPKQILLGGIYIVRSVAIAAYFSFPASAMSTMVFAAVMGSLWLGVVPLVNGLVAQLFGLRFMATLTGIAFLSHQVGSFIGAWGSGVIYDRMGNYDMAWKSAVVIGIVAGSFQMLMNVRPPKQKEELAGALASAA